jgi:hypothetical protein
MPHGTCDLSLHDKLRSITIDRDLHATKIPVLVRKNLGGGQDFR